MLLFASGPHPHSFVVYAGMSEIKLSCRISVKSKISTDFTYLGCLLYDKTCFHFFRTHLGGQIQDGRQYGRQNLYTVISSLVSGVQS